MGMSSLGAQLPLAGVQPSDENTKSSGSFSKSTMWSNKNRDEVANIPYKPDSAGQMGLFAHFSAMPGMVLTSLTEPARARHLTGFRVRYEWLDYALRRRRS